MKKNTSWFKRLNLASGSSVIISELKRSNKDKPSNSMGQRITKRECYHCGGQHDATDEQPLFC